MTSAQLVVPWSVSVKLLIENGDFLVGHGNSVASEQA